MYPDKAPAFTPPPFNPIVAATRINERSPVWKMHTSLGKAKNAVGYACYYENGVSCARGGELWTLANEKWVLLYYVRPKTPVKELPWKTNKGY